MIGWTGRHFSGVREILACRYARQSRGWTRARSSSSNRSRVTWTLTRHQWAAFPVAVLIVSTYQLHATDRVRLPRSAAKTARTVRSAIWAMISW